MLKGFIWSVSHVKMMKNKMQFYLNVQLFFYSSLVSPGFVCVCWCLFRHMYLVCCSCSMQWFLGEDLCFCFPKHVILIWSCLHFQVHWSPMSYNISTQRSKDIMISSCVHVFAQIWNKDFPFSANFSINNMWVMWLYFGISSPDDPGYSMSKSGPQVYQYAHCMNFWEARNTISKISGPKVIYHS